ncbi:MAG: 1-acyl-sn-glycerol-3-phosphate acyltransferase [Anaerolineae bacterium]|nr:1-acyl-sn-glycerol-3-phosphate acyltransferase [Anaerolineae bacterium]
MKFIQRILLETIRLPIVLLWYLSGWQISQPIPPDTRLVVTGAPHTSNWDYYLFLLAITYLRRRPFVTVKKELFFPPVGWILRLLGGVSIDRQHPKGIVEQITEKVKNTKPILMVFTPEGTRSYTDHWKAGFYHVALGADTRILCVALNYEEKILYLDLVFKPTGDIEADFEQIKAYQEQYGRGKYPKNVGKVLLRPKDIAQARQKATEQVLASIENSS